MLNDAINQGSQLFLTGELRHHDALAALDRGCAVIVTGHTNTERGYLPLLRDRLAQLVPSVSFVVSTKDRFAFETIRVG